jgi:hypothetical protein
MSVAAHGQFIIPALLSALSSYRLGGGFCAGITPTDIGIAFTIGDKAGAIVSTPLLTAATTEKVGAEAPPQTTMCAEISVLDADTIHFCTNAPVGTGSSK